MYFAVFGLRFNYPRLVKKLWITAEKLWISGVFWDVSVDKKIARWIFKWVIG
jgi:hypothetical protein